MESIFDEEKKVEGLSNKVAELIRRYTEARDENEKLRTELAAVKAQNGDRMDADKRLKSRLTDRAVYIVVRIRAV